MLFSGVAAYAGSLQLPVYTQGYTTDEFLYQRNLPEISQNTFCFWINLGADEDGYNFDFLFSISTLMSPDAYSVGFESEVIRILGGDSRIISVSLTDIIHLFTGWHKHCFTWISDQFFKWYAEVNTPGDLELMVSHAIGSYNISAEGALILMHEQNAYFGGLDINQLSAGKIAWVNMWDYAMSDEEIKMLKCRDEGNVVNWNTLSQQGASHIHYETFECQGKATEAYNL
ncbi:C-reactive protein-like [Watersipora subatra]|uniref:C-reactive protein-like n=1 Tax=Watersipora subatra TaxID=2589382 RepID=UPI00355B0597